MYSLNKNIRDEIKVYQVNKITGISTIKSLETCLSSIQYKYKQAQM